MLNIVEFDQWCARNSIQEKTRAEIERIRLSQPSRRVGSTTKNVSGRYPSRKMGMTIQFESHTVELPKILEMEHDDTEVLEFYDQPPSLKLTYHKEGRTLGYIYTADFFVICENGAGWVECKTDEELEKLAAKAPHRYFKDEQGIWHMLPGEEYAAKMGLTFNIFPSSRINHMLMRNIIFLEDYYRMDATVVSKTVSDTILSIINGSQGITLGELLARSGTATADDIYIMIATEQIYVDLCAFPLGEPDNTSVYSSRDIAQVYCRAGSAASSIIANLKYIKIDIGAQIIWDGKPWTVVNVGEANTYLKSGDGSNNVITLDNRRVDEMIRSGEIRRIEGAASCHDSPVLEFLKKASPEDHKEAIERLRIVTTFLNSCKAPGNCTISLRTIYRWTAGYKTARELYGDGYVGLLPKTYAMGHDDRKIGADVLDVIHDFINNEYETYKQLSKMNVYGKLLLRLEEKRLPEVSYKTFAKELKNRPKYEQVKDRKGERAANDYEFFWRLGQNTPKHGDRPFEIAHLDHTEADVELVTAEGIALGRPWLTFMIDAFSRLILAFFVSFDPPSYRSCMAALRHCVQKFGRLPQAIVVDGGSDFKSGYFEALLARYEVTKKTRPATKARFGGVLERLFGTTNTQFIHTLEGNTQITREVRHVTKLNNPRNLAVWTLNDFIESLSIFVDKYSSRKHSTLGQSPREAFEFGIDRAGIRPNRMIVYDEAFRIFTLPSTPKGTAKVMPRLGVKIKNIYYWSDMFRAPQIEGTDVPVKYDPFNIGTAYAYIGNQWMTCISEYYDKFKYMTEKELQVRSEIIRKRNSSTAKGMRISAKDLAHMHVDNDNKEKLLKQQIKDSELRKTVALQDVTTQPRPDQEDNTKPEAVCQPNAEDIDPKKFVSYGEY